MIEGKDIQRYEASPMDVHIFQKCYNCSIIIAVMQGLLIWSSSLFLKNKAYFLNLNFLFYFLVEGHAPQVPPAWVFIHQVYPRHAFADNRGRHGRAIKTRRNGLKFG